MFYNSFGKNMAAKPFHSAYQVFSVISKNGLYVLYFTLSEKSQKIYVISIAIPAKKSWGNTVLPKFCDFCPES